MSSDADKVKKAEQPGIDAMKMHPFYKGKVETILKCCVRDYDDFGIWYTPGVAKPCLDIRDNPDKVFEVRVHDAAASCPVCASAITAG